MSHPDKVRIFKDNNGDCLELPIIESNGNAWAVVWPGVGAEFRSIHHISLRPVGRTIRLTHPMEAVYYLMRGTATAVDPENGSRHDLVEGSMAHIEPGTAYIFEAGGDGAEIIGGPCPADHTMYTHIEN